jgi:hypothetical protein
VSLFEPPESVYYAAPTYFGSTWIDEDRYPSDTEIDFEAGVVVYRNGLESPAAPETTPTVEALSADPIVGGLEVQWAVTAGGINLTGAVDVTVTPDGESSFTTQGNGSATLTGLDQKNHTVEIFSTSTTATPKRPQKTVTITAWRAADMSYTYRYESEASPDTFADGFDTDHASPSFPLEVSSQNAVEQQQVVFSWSDGETQRVTQTVEWEAPTAPVETTKDVVTGAVLPAGQVPQPDFGRARYAGSRTIRLATNVYQPGELELSPEGYLPPGIDGEIEDFVSLTFITPEGDEVGSSIELSTQTELRVRADISATGGQSPVFYGARVLRTTTP